MSAFAPVLPILTRSIRVGWLIERMRNSPNRYSGWQMAQAWAEYESLGAVVPSHPAT
jgi:hypothetical protein